MNETAPGRSGRLHEALRWSSVLGFVGASASLLVTSFAEGWVSTGRLAAAAAAGGAPAFLAGAGFGLLRTPRSRLVAVWVVPPLALAAGALFIWLVLWPQADHGGLATAAVAFLALLVALATAAVALLHTLTRRSPPRTQLGVLAAAGAAMLLVAVVHVATTPSPEERGWIEVPEELRGDAIPPGAGAPAAPTTLGGAAPAPDGAATTLTGAAASPDVSGSATAVAPPSYDAQRDADCPEDEPEPPLFAAIRAGDLGRVRSLLAGDRVSANLHCDYGEGTGAYPLELALVESRPAIAEALLDAGADPSLAGQGSAPPLWLAAHAGSERLVRRLLAAGADPDTAHGDVPVLYEVAGTVYAGVVRALLDAGANPNAAYLGNAAIHHAAEGNAPEVVRALVAGGADLDAGNRFGLPPAAVAARAGKAELARILLDAGGRDATWAVRGALDGGHLDLALALAARGVNVENHIEGCSVLVLAAEKGDVPLLRAILAGNARVQESCLREALEAARRGPEGGEPVVQVLSALR